MSKDCRRMYNEEFHNWLVYSSPNVADAMNSRRMRWTIYVARMQETRNAYTVLVIKREEKKTLGRPRRGWERMISKWISNK